MAEPDTPPRPYRATGDSQRPRDAGRPTADEILLEGPQPKFRPDAMLKTDPWRVFRIESDLRPMTPQERGEPERGMPGGVPGM